MQKADIKVGREYALRESRTPGTPLQHVRIVEHIRRNKWRAEWIEPNPGLKDYVESQHLVVPWQQGKAFLRDEESEQRLREHNARLGGIDDSPVAVAVGEVLASTGEHLMVLEGALICHPAPSPVSGSAPDSTRRSGPRSPTLIAMGRFTCPLTRRSNWRGRSARLSLLRC